MLYKIYYGLGGGFNKREELENPIEFKNKDDAEEYAFDLACEVYDSYAGYYGLRSIEQIIEEDEVDEEEAQEIYEEERSSWLIYDAEEIESMK